MSKAIMNKFKTIIDNFSETFHKEYDGHRVASPLGAWMLLAYVAVEHPNPSEKLMQRLGCSTAEAKEILVTLMKDKPAVLATAVNAWVSSENGHFPSVQKWMKAAEGVGDIKVKTPSKDELDAWTQENSLGLIETFPLEIDPDTFVSMFATLLATKIDWETPFEVLPDKMMEKAWKQEKFLKEPNSKGANISFYEDETGLYAIHEATNEDVSLSVLSVIAVDPETPEADVMAVARKAASDDIANVSYQSLDVTTDTLKVEDFMTSSKNDSFTTLLPAWKTENTYEIGEAPTLAFDDVAQRFNDFDMQMNAVQVAVAEYNRTGFEAAALTAMMIGARSCLPKMTMRKAVTLNFNHPYAVIAVVREGTWKNLPVFDGWVSEATEVKEG